MNIIHKSPNNDNVWTFDEKRRLIERFNEKTGSRTTWNHNDDDYTCITTFPDGQQMKSCYDVRGKLISVNTI